MVVEDRSALGRALDDLRKQQRALTFYRQTCWLLFALLMVSLLWR